MEQMAYTTRTTTSFLWLVGCFVVIWWSLLVPACAASGYGGNHPPQLSQQSADGMNEKPLPIGVQGTILCKSDDGYRPLPGATARITCVAEEEHGYETAPFSVSSSRSDDQGYYFATLYLSEVMMSDDLKLKECKAFLETPPDATTCDYPTDQNGGVTGATLTSHTVLEEKRMKLYTVKPFAYSTTAGPASAPSPADDYDDGY